jgi:hypothetical protein
MLPAQGRFAEARSGVRQLHYSAVIDAPADAVWKAVGAFGSWGAWMPTIVAEEIEDGRPQDQVGCVRRLTTETGAVARERLLALSQVERSFSYNVVSSPNYAMDDYVSTMRVVEITESPERCLVEWSCRFSAADEAAEDEIAAGLGARIYRGGLAALRAHFQAGNPKRGGDDDDPR